MRHEEGEITCQIDLTENDEGILCFEFTCKDIVKTAKHSVPSSLRYHCIKCIIQHLKFTSLMLHKFTTNDSSCFSVKHLTYFKVGINEIQIRNSNSNWN